MWGLLRPLGPGGTTARRTILIAFALVFCWSVFLHFWSDLRPANEQLRITFVQALVDHGDLSVDPVFEALHPGLEDDPGYAAGTRHPNIDVAHYKGRFYMDKAPGLSLFVTPVYALLSAMGLHGPVEDWVLLGTLLTLLGVMLPALLGLLAVRQIVGRLGGRPEAAWTAALVVGLGTPYALYATLFFGHALAGALAALSCLYAIDRRPWLAGALSGAMVLVDTPTALLALSLGLATGFSTRSLKDLMRFAAAGLPFVALQLAFNATLFGDPFTFAYGFKVNAQFAAIIQEGVYGFGWPGMEALWGLSFGSARGLFFHAPVLLLGALGGVMAWRRRKSSGDATFWPRALTLMSLAYFLWIGAFTDWRAGASFGPRHLVPIVPFLGVGVGMVLSSTWVQLPKVGPWFQWLFPGSVAVGLLSVWAPALTFPYAPEAFEAPLFELSVPMLFRGQLADSWLPQAGAVIALGAAMMGLWIASRPAMGARWFLLTTLRAALAGIFLVGLLLASLSPPAEKAQREGVHVATWLGQCQVAEVLCKEQGGRALVRGNDCRCRWPRGTSLKVSPR